MGAVSAGGELPAVGGDVVMAAGAVMGVAASGVAATEVVLVGAGSTRDTLGMPEPCARGLPGAAQPLARRGIYSQWVLFCVLAAARTHALCAHSVTVALRLPEETERDGKKKAPSVW